MTELEQLAKRKLKLNSESDLCFELLDVWFGRLYDSEDDETKYELYTRLIGDLEEYTQLMKIEILDTNKRICEILKVDSIESTEYAYVPKAKYNNDF